MKASKCALLAVILAFSVRANTTGAEPATSPSASAGSSASAASASPPKIEIPPWPSHDDLAAFDAEPFSEEKTKAPKSDEWKSAAEVRLSRVSPTISSCHAYRLREWMKVHCDSKTAGLRLLAGSTDGIALWVADAIVPAVQLVGTDLQQLPSHFETLGRFGEIIFPIRRGDRRLFEWLSLDISEEYEGGMSVSSRSTMLLEEQWLEGARPELALLAR